MHPTTVWCPQRACPARGHTGQGHMGLDWRQDQRCICTQGRQTVTTTQGTAVSRLRRAAETVPLVRTLRAHGCPRPAIVVACGVDARTGAEWWGRAGAPGHAVQAPLVERRLVQGSAAHVEGIRHRSPGDGASHTAASARLQATCRARRASLTRRGRAWARRPRTWPPGR
jgi:hypothetical protein